MLVVPTYSHASLISITNVTKMAPRWVQQAAQTALLSANNCSTQPKTIPHHHRIVRQPPPGSQLNAECMLTTPFCWRTTHTPQCCSPPAQAGRACPGSGLTDCDCAFFDAPHTTRLPCSSTGERCLVLSEFPTLAPPRRSLQGFTVNKA